MMGAKVSYRNLTDYERQLLDSFPVLTAENLEAVNNLFKHYVFYESVPGGWQLSTSCCHRSDENYAFLQELETYEHWKFISSKHNDDVICPYCGKHATLKNVGISKNCVTLEEEHSVAFWHCVNDVVFAQCYWTCKDFIAFGRDCEPRYDVSVVYAFYPNHALMFYQHSYAWEVVHENAAIGKRLRIVEPFARSGWSGSGHYNWYFDFGRDEAIATSPLKYSQLDSFELCHRQHPRMHASPMKYLSLYCIYPRAVEMLMKCGMRNAIDSFIFEGVKSAGAIKWDETDPRRAFDLNGQELRAFMELPQHDTEILACYKLLRKNSIKMKMDEIAQLKSDVYALGLSIFIKTALKQKTTPKKLLNYLNRFTGGCHVGGGYRGICETFSHWCDYITAATAIGYDMNTPNVRFPRDLFEAHDNATAEHNRRLEIEREKLRLAEETRRAAADKELRARLKREEKERWEKEKAELNRREARFCFADGEFLIRPAADADEIIAEGKALEHCVGGYANRHMQGQLTICFMRLASAPDIPFLTIEMRGSELVQIHGFKNEQENGKRVGLDPKIAYKDFLDPWMRWVKHGSCRDKDGNPIIPANKKRTQKKKEANAA